MKTLAAFLLLLISPATLWASYPEFFGASFSTTAVGNQSNLDFNDPSNNYYIPAGLGFSNKVNVLMQATSTATHFKPMENIVVSNSTNSNSVATGRVSNEYPKFHGSSLHLSLPIGYEHLGTLGLSLFLPVGDLLETHSGNPFLPEYVMYRSRYRRTSVYFNFARKWSEDISWSLGAIVGYQATADVKANLSLNGADYGSWGQAQSKVSPALGAIASVIKKADRRSYYFTYQQEMKSNLHAGIFGEINNPSLALFESSIDSMIFYDPHTFRIGTGYDFGGMQFLASLEYQLWSGYTPPTIFISKNGGVIVPSSNYERISLRDTVNPRVGLSFDLTDRWKTGLGLAYRMTPLKGDFSGSGNSIDSNTTILSTGLQYRILIWTKDVNLGTSLQYQQLEKKRVNKTAGQENGNAGPKIGSGGYDIDGYVLAASFGVKFNF